MKKILLCTLLFSASIYAQKKNIYISEVTTGSLKLKYAKSIDLDKNDTLYYVFCGFQNKEYESIVDFKSIFIAEKEDLLSFIKDLKTAISEMDSKVNINWKRENYQLNLYDFVNQLYIYERPSKGSGYTTLSKKEVEQFVSWLETIDFGKG